MMLCHQGMIPCLAPHKCNYPRLVRCWCLAGSATTKRAAQRRGLELTGRVCLASASEPSMNREKFCVHETRPIVGALP